MTGTTLSKDGYLARLETATHITDIVGPIFRRLEEILSNYSCEEEIGRKLRDMCRCLEGVVHYREKHGKNYCNESGIWTHNRTPAIVRLDDAAAGIIYFFERGLRTFFESTPPWWNDCDPHGLITRESLQQCADLVKAYSLFEELFAFAQYNHNDNETSTYKYLTAALTTLTEANQELLDLGCDEVSLSAFTPQNSNRCRVESSLMQISQTAYVINIAEKFDAICEQGLIQDKEQLFHIERIQKTLLDFRQFVLQKEHKVANPKNWKEARGGENYWLCRLTRDTSILSYDAKELSKNTTFSWDEFDPSKTITPESLLKCERLISVYAKLQLVQWYVFYMREELDKCLEAFKIANMHVVSAGFAPIPLSILDPKGAATNEGMEKRLKTRFPKFLAFRLRDEFAELADITSMDERSFTRRADRIIGYHDFIVASGHTPGTSQAVINRLQAHARRLNVGWQP